MFSYYGSKSKIVKYYPSPKYKKIIEPFAGSARYSLKYFDNDVTIIDKYEVVIKIWKWLQKCSPADILGLPKFKEGDDLRNYNLSEEELLFLGMCAGIASTSPRYKISPYANEQNGNKNRFKRIADQLFKIKHWKIIHGSYDDVSNTEATWFIDPPYQFGGHAYVMDNSKLDFDVLRTWCETRKGQVIVCENTKATWMDFLPVKIIQGAGQTFTTEAIWTNLKTSYSNEQLKLIA